VKNYYATLGVSETASEQEIKKAYRKLAKENHPDATGGDKKKGERFKEVSEAYSILSDKTKRSQYDQLRHNPQAQNAQWGGATGVDISDIFAQFFGGAAGRSAAGNARGGVHFRVEHFGEGGGGFGDMFDMFGQQSRRRGRRAEPAAEPARATGVLELDFRDAALGGVKPIAVDGKTLQIRIPPGVDNGSRLRAGDITFEIRVRPDATFRRDGPDIHSDLAISIDEAVLGAKIPVATLEAPVTVTVPPGTSSGATLRLRGKGVASTRGAHGDHYVHIRIAVPKQVSPRARELLEEFARVTGFKPRS
jgi:DnaJ-class molecular chaperone